MLYMGKALSGELSCVGTGLVLLILFFSLPVSRCMITHTGEATLPFSFLPLLARLDEVQEVLLYYPGIGVGVCVGVSKMLKFLR